MNLGEMISSIRFNIDDPKGNLIDDGGVRIIINRAYNHLYRKLINVGVHYNQATVDVTFTSAAQEVVVGGTDSANTFRPIQLIVLAQNDRNEIIPVRDKETSLASDTPSIYWLKVRPDRTTNIEPLGGQVDKVGWYLTPSSNIVVTITYIPTVGQFQRGDADGIINSEIPEEHHDVIVNYATVLVLAKDEDNVATWSQIYQDSLRDMLETAGLRNPKTSGVVDVMEGQAWE